MNEEPFQPIGTGHAEAWLRGGLTEIDQVLPAFPDGIQPIDEYGLWGVALPQEVFEQRHALDIAPVDAPQPSPEQDLEIEM
ncbi:MAG: hypothetical protein U0836_23980 [Pirellulales bacterium]